MKTLASTTVKFALFSSLIALFHILLSKHCDWVPQDFLIEFYALIIGITLFILIVASIVSLKATDYVGYTFLGGMIAKMAIVLAFIYVNKQIKFYIVHLLFAYFALLWVEVVLFIQLLKRKRKDI